MAESDKLDTLINTVQTIHLVEDRDGRVYKASSYSIEDSILYVESSYSLSEEDKITFQELISEEYKLYSLQRITL